MTLKERAEFVQKYMPSDRLKEFIDWDKKRKCLFVLGFITESENKRIIQRMEKKALKEASEVRKNAIGQ